MNRAGHRRTITIESDDYPPFDGFPAEGLRFLRRLKTNNNRPWFTAHKDEYEDLVKAPMQALIAALRPSFDRFAPEYDLNPKRAVFRIYRDTRFSKDKTPYKTHIAAHLVLRGGDKGIAGSGYYLEVEPGGCFVGAGIYIPDGEQIKKIRTALLTRGNEFLAAIRSRRFVKRFGTIDGERLKRPPRGVPAGHAMSEWLMLKQFFAGVSLPVERCLRREFADEVAAICEDATPLVRFLNRAVRGSARI